ncbi:hypothetical protein, partial [Escherichia coli]|uniref:hypothetical protein n=1 Tax=Escherichia coli TaxID=562 RepID=UPI003CF502A8
GSTSKTPSYTKSVSWHHYLEKGIGIYAVFLKILIIGMDFRARKGFYMDTLLIISSSHHQQFTSLFRV